MANVTLKQLKLKYTKTAGKLPTSTDITEGELALNLTDKRIYSRIDDQIVELGGVNGSVTGNIDVDGTVKAGSISLDNPVDIIYGGTGSKTKEGARTNLEVYSKTESDNLYVNKNTTINGYKLNQNIVLTSTDTGSLSQANNLSDVKNIDTARVNINAAKQGVNTDITEIAGLNTALSIQQGGTGSKTKEGALLNLGGFPLAGGTISGDVLVTGKIMDSGSQQVYSPNNKPTLLALGAAKSGANSDITSLTDVDFMSKALTLGSTLTVSGDTTLNAAKGASFSGTDQNNFRIMSSASSVFQRLDGSAWYFMTADSPTGTYNDLRPLSINLTTGRVSLGNGASMGDNLVMNGNAITGSNQINFNTSANARQTLINMGVSGNAGRVVIPISTTQAWCMQTGTSVLSFNSSGEATLSFPTAFASIGTFVCSNGDGNVPGDGYVDSLDSWSLTTSSTNLRNRRITGGGSVIWVTGSYRVNWVATGIINI